MARTFEFVLHFVRCVTVTVSPNQIIIIIIIIIIISLKTGQNNRKLEHVNSLSIQGKLIAAINTEFNRTDINKWTWNLEKLAAPLFKFVRKALQQQLPTAANLHQMGKNPRLQLSSMSTVPVQQARVV